MCRRVHESLAAAHERRARVVELADHDVERIDGRLEIRVVRMLAVGASQQLAHHDVIATQLAERQRQRVAERYVGRAALLGEKRREALVRVFLLRQTTHGGEIVLYVRLVEVRPNFRLFGRRNQMTRNRERTSDARQKRIVKSRGSPSETAVARRAFAARKKVRNKSRNGISSATPNAQYYVPLV